MGRFFLPGFIKSVPHIVVFYSPPDLGGGLQKLVAEADHRSGIEVRTSNKDRGVVIATLAVVVLP